LPLSYQTRRSARRSALDFWLSLRLNAARFVRISRRVADDRPAYLPQFDGKITHTADRRVRQKACGCNGIPVRPFGGRVQMTPPIIRHGSRSLTGNDVADQILLIPFVQWIVKNPLNLKLWDLLTRLLTIQTRCCLPSASCTSLITFSFFRSDATDFILLVHPHAS
jgi:hypothetical protein